MKCQVCGKEVDLPFRCSYCSGYFCVVHRLPENHQCTNLPKEEFWYQKQKIAQRQISVPERKALMHEIKRVREKPTSGKPRISRREFRELLPTYLVSSIFTIIGLAIVYWQVHSPALWFLLVFYVIPLPVILIGILIFLIGFLSTIGIAVSVIKKPSISIKLLAIPLIFSLALFSFFGIIVLSTVHKTFYIGTNFVNVEYIQERVFNLINEERLSRNQPELLFDNKLEQIAQTWSEDLAERNRLEHGNFKARVSLIGYGSYQCGEIIARIELGGIGFFQTPVERQFVDGWLESLGHRDIMLTLSSGFLGVGVAKNSGSIYAVADFRFD